MTPDDMALLGELRNLLGDRETSKPGSRVWRMLLEPALDEAVNDALAGMSDLKKTAAERGEYAQAYHAAVRLRDLLPGRMKELEAEIERTRAKR